jgi:hypothetical protein
LINGEIKFLIVGEFNTPSILRVECLIVISKSLLNLCEILKTLLIKIGVNKLSLVGLVGLILLNCFLNESKIFEDLILAISKGL